MIFSDFWQKGHFWPKIGVFRPKLADFRPKMTILLPKISKKRYFYKVYVHTLFDEFHRKLS